MRRERGSGLLLHLSSLPSPFGIGDLGPKAFEFVDFLDASKQKYWQLLPLSPTHPHSDNSPYHSQSAFAFNPLYLSPEILVQDGLLKKREIENPPFSAGKAVDFKTVFSYKEKLSSSACNRFQKSGVLSDFEEFCTKNSDWVDDYALFTALKKKFRGLNWNRWPAEIRNRHPRTLKLLKKELSADVFKEKALQFLFDKQWRSLKRYCRQKNIRLIGDIPIYVVHDSADLWISPHLFKLDSSGKPTAVAGVPPDYFSRTGQLWGNPLYDWEEMRKSDYAWWMRRLEHTLGLFNKVRIDHFRGFVGYWEVPAGHKTALRGKWVKAPAEEFFRCLTSRFPQPPLIAEDLGTITAEVRHILQLFQFPGMKVLLFAFGGENPNHPYLPHMFEENCVAYTGTHDNNTVRGWFEKEADAPTRKRVFRYIGRTVSAASIHWEFIRLLLQSKANTVIFPVQDILGLGAEARMNRPATTGRNWRWRLVPGQLEEKLSERLGGLTESSGRV